MYDPTTQGLLLLDSVAIQGRKNDLKQLIKLLAQSKTGQPKAVLLTGEPGIGKTALLETFAEVARTGLYCRTVFVRGKVLASAEDLYVALLESLHGEAEAIFDDALAAINALNTDMGIDAWSRADLLRTIGLVKLQESVAGGKDALSQEQLVKAIRGSVPPVKKLKFAVNEHVEKLVNIIVNPWLTLATAILNPTLPALEEALTLAHQLKSRQKTQNAAASRPRQTAGDESENSDLASDEEEMTVALTPVPPSANPDVEPLVHHLSEVFHFVNRTLQPLETALVMLLDDWDLVSDLPESERERMKDLMSGFLREFLDRKNYHLMLMLACRSVGESYSLGGSLFGIFRQKMLLTGVNENARQKLLRASLKTSGIEIEESVFQHLAMMTRGNPYWLLRAQRYLRERALSSRISRIDAEFFGRLGIQTLRDLLELNFTRLKLSFLKNEDAFYNALKVIVERFGTCVFGVDDCLQAVRGTLGYEFSYVFEVLRALYLLDFLEERGRTANGDPRYSISGRLTAEFLLEKTQNIRTDMTPRAKLDYLKRIIPLSIRSGELDREKTREVLTLSASLGDTDMLRFLEETFIGHLTDKNASVRVTALNNLTLLETDRALEAIVRSLSDHSDLVREYAARNLAILAETLPISRVQALATEPLLQTLHDPSEAVRIFSYRTLARLDGQAFDATSVFLRGLSDESDTIRLTAIESLVKADNLSPMTRDPILEASRDTLPAIRYQACLGLQKLHDNECIQRLTEMLCRDPDNSVRALAADCLSRMEDPKAIESMVRALRNDPSEDVQLSIIRALGKHRGPATEEIILYTLFNSPTPPTDAMLWVCVRSLGDTGLSDRSLRGLDMLRQQHPDNEILQVSINFAMKKIASRLQFHYNPTPAAAEPGASSSSNVAPRPLALAESAAIPPVAEATSSVVASAPVMAEASPRLSAQTDEAAEGNVEAADELPVHEPISEPGFEAEDSLLDGLDPASVLPPDATSSEGAQPVTPSPVDAEPPSSFSMNLLQTPIPAEMPSTESDPHRTKTPLESMVDASLASS